MRTWLNWTAAAVAAAVLLAWDYPTGAVVAWIAVCTLCALAVIEFLDVPALDDALPPPQPAPTAP
jgi:hypothetical protein